MEPHVSEGNGSIQHSVTKVIDVKSDDTELFAYQVAGHNLSDAAVLKHKSGYLMKPIQSDSRGLRELEFYRKIYEGTEDPCSTEVRRRLQRLTPTFFGLSSKASGDGSQMYLMLQDVTSGLLKPCIMDLKIGTITWNPFASDSKIEKEKAKYVGTKGPLGISLAGMSHYDINQNESIRKDRLFGRTLNPETLLTTFKEYLNYDHAKSRTIIKLILNKLQAIQDFFNTQHEFEFYSSSVLIAYGAEAFFSKSGQDDTGHVTRVKVNEDMGDTLEDESVRVYMIDFAHVVPMSVSDEPMSPCKKDENYLFGLKNVIRLFQRLDNENQ